MREKKRKYNILIVDDEPNNLETLKRTLRRDYKVFTAETAEEALKVLEENTIAVIITDQRMPGMTGTDLLEETLENDQHIIRIIVTGYSDIESLIEAVNKCQLFYYIKKPWKSEEMLEVVENAVERYELFYHNIRVIDEQEKRIQKLEEAMWYMSNNPDSLLSDS